MSKVIWHRVGFFFVTLCDWSGKKLALHFDETRRNSKTNLVFLDVRPFARFRFEFQFTILIFTAFDPNVH